jgi:hypothetical protein
LSTLFVSSKKRVFVIGRVSVEVEEWGSSGKGNEMGE